MTQSGQRHALVVLRALYNYLLLGGYVRANPFALIRRKGTRRGNNPGKTIPQPVMKEFLAFLDSSALHGKTALERLKRERELFVLTWLYFTACRREELAIAKHRDIKAYAASDETKLRWTVFGKGESEAWVPLKIEAISALRRYVKAHGLGQAADLPILVSLKVHRNNLKADQIWDIVRAACERFAEHAPHYKNLCEQISPHWLRHAITAHLLDDGTDIRYVQRLLRHSYITTTMLYDSTDDQKFASAIG